MVSIQNGQPVTIEIKPVEIGGKRVLTTEQLAEIYQTDINNIQVNFKNHKGKFTEGKHFYLLQGEKLKEFKNHLNNIQLVGKRASSLYLWTERGANRHCKILDTDKAWQQFDNLEETYFRVKENKVEVNQLSPELQMFKQIFDSVAKQQLEQQQIRAEVKETKEEVQAIRDVIKLDTTSWRKEAADLIIKMALNMGGHEHIKHLRQDSYMLLEQRLKCSLSTRLTNKRRRMADEGICKSKRDKLNKLDIIGEDVRLLEGYLAIVKEMAIKYGV
ncbi:ORF6N domain-containing protein [Clostridium botulinum]|uniref:ORF6N domain-containing protein n=1 Tax=Clostridium botulinum TaxID=1491 RepID=UPI003DA2FBC1